eukprot:GHRQ01019535.1.p1 GENE.GHRQ01019535.1~~GHRQ01019535.1.p1  ORF type:complete len:106 (-),score=9.43 GHRQ01019535.1:687-1004(-)
MKPVYMLDFSVFKPPEEYKLNHDAGIVNASRWSVSTSCSRAASLNSSWCQECRHLRMLALSGLIKVTKHLHVVMDKHRMAVVAQALQRLAVVRQCPAAALQCALF